MKLYAVLDVKAQLPVLVFQSNTDVEAERRFLSLLTTVESTVFTANPGDFALLSFGDFSYHSDCLTLAVESSVALTIKSGNEYSKSYLNETRMSRLDYHKAIQSYVDAHIKSKTPEVPIHE